MSRSTINNRRFALLDALLELRDLSAGAITATTTENPIQLDANKLLYYKAVLNLAAYTGFIAGVAQWDIYIEVSGDGGSTYKTLGTMTAPGESVIFDIGFTGEQVEDLISGGQFTDADLYVRARSVKTGSPTSLNYGAYLTC